MALKSLNVVFCYLEEQLQKEVISVLKSGGYNPAGHSFDNIDSLEAYLRNEQADIIISDFDLPDSLNRQAFETCKKLVPDIPVVLLVGDKNEEKAARAVSDNILDYVLKTGLKRIISSVRAALNYSREIRIIRDSESSRMRNELINSALISNLSDALLVIDDAMNVVYANELAREYLVMDDGLCESIIERFEKHLLSSSGEPCKQVRQFRERLKDSGQFSELVQVQKANGSVVRGVINIRLIKTETVAGEVFLITIRNFEDVYLAEEAVSEYRGRYKTLFDTLSDGVMLLEINPFRILDHNKKILEIFGVEGNEISQISLDNLVYEEEGFTLELLLSFLNQAMEGDQVKFDWLCTDTGGKHFWVAVSLSLLEVNSSSQLVLLMRDIDEQKRMEEALRKSQEEFMNLAENSPDVIMRFDSSMRHLYVNHSVQTHLGLSPDLFLMKTHEEMGIFPEHLVKFWEENMAVVVETGKLHTCKFEIENDLKKIIYEWRLIPEKFDEEGKVETYVAVARDVTENQLVIERINESKRMLYLVMDTIPQAIFWKDTNMRYIGGNKTFCKLAGIENPEDLVGKSDEELCWIKEHIEDIKSKQLEVLATGEPLVQEYYKVKLESGSTLDMICNVVPLDDDAGNIIGILGTNEDVTLQMGAEKALADSEERLQQALQATSMGLWDWDLVTGEIYFSASYFSMLGYSYDEWPHNLDTWESLLHPDEKEKVINYLRDHIEKEADTYSLDFMMQKKSGEYVWVRGRGRIVHRDEDGKALRLVGTNEDISARKKQEIMHDVIFNVSNAVNTTKNLEDLYEEIREFLGRVVDTTNCFLALYNQETNTLSLPFLRDEKDSFTEFPAGKTLTGYVIKTGKSQLVDAGMEEELTRQGEIEPVGTPCISWLGVPLKVEERIIGVFVVQSYEEGNIFSTEDVHLLEFASEQIALAIERKRDQDNLWRNQDRQRRIFESSPDAMIVVDLSGSITDFNTSFLEIFKVERDIAINENLFNFFFPNDRKKAFTYFERTWSEGYLKNNEYRMMRGDGSSFEAEISTGAIFDNEGHPDSMLFIMKNIDLRKETERNLREAKEKAEEADRLKTAFLSNMSHEIRTPMNAIIGFADLLSDPSASAEEKLEYIAQINYGADNLMHLIDDIIDISKIEAGQISVNYSECNIYDLMQELRVMFTQTIIRLDKTSLRIRFSWDWPAEHLILRTDPFRLKQILINLLSNAVKFTDEGSVDLGIEKVDGMVRIFVRDSGIGIVKEKHEVIFDRFRQGHESKTRLYGGTGLGLAISKNLVELLGGRIGLFSTPGEGSEFWILLPLDEIKKESSHVIQEHVKKASYLNGKKILIAEDDYSNYYFIKEALKYENIELIWARDGQEALDLFHEIPDIDAVLMDIQMPVMDGYECTRQIKKEKPDLPVIAQTAYAMAGERQLSKEAGCDNHLSKPIKVLELLEVLQLHIR